ncbi:M15 family metallopeptidase [Kineosporia sp. R_H_3]|uniref:M15 family metallopeptidase n=1 Tax=Kineosporia sp. R_H_3 TaxID=1961848 RepID=UPI0018E91F23
MARGGRPPALGPVGRCPGGPASAYPNGRIPLDALCPLSFAPGEHLRADAAHGFEQLARAYSRQFGAAPCITDSYRPLSVQVTLSMTKPRLAARPGTSNHGWGTALDLCGGVQSFGTAEHTWMLVHAPLYGWFHPAWAQQGGSKPEAWHFEYGG